MVSDQEPLRLGEVEDWAHGLPESFLYCREMGHNWLPYTAGRYKDGGFERVLRCGRCKTRKRQEISARGLLLGTRYEHPDGYLTHGMGPIVGEERGVLRLESMQRIVRKTEQKSERKAGGK